MKDTDFSELHDAQAHALGEALPMVDTIKEFEPNALSKQIKKPCILIEVAEMAPTGGVGNIIWLNAQFQAHCLLPVAIFVFHSLNIDYLTFFLIVSRSGFSL